MQYFFGLFFQIQISFSNSHSPAPGEEMK